MRFVVPSCSKCSKLGHYNGFCKSNRGPVPTGEVSRFQFHCFRIIRKNMSSVENFLNRSYPRFASTTTSIPPLSRNFSIITTNLTASLGKNIEKGKLFSRAVSYSMLERNRWLERKEVTSNSSHLLG